MANKPVEIEFVAQIASYLRDTKKVSVATEDISDALVAVTNDADDLERKLSRAMKDAESDVETLERAIKELPKATEKAGDEAKKDFGRIADSAKEAGTEAGSEFKQNLGGALASGGSPADVVIESLGGLVSGLSGPFGIAAAGVAAVVAIGFQRIQAQAEQMKQLTEGLLENMRDNLGKGLDEIDAAVEESKFQDWVKDNIDLFKGINDELDAAEINAHDYARALYDGGPALEEMEDKLLAVRDTNKEVVTQGDRTKVVYNEAGDAADELLSKLQNTRSTHSDINEEARVFGEITGENTAKVGELDAKLRAVPTDIAVTFRTLGSVDRNSVNYSPGHEAVMNYYAYKAKRGESP